ncbi:glycosyltransferase family 10 domain-containing protein, partial [Parabacteroides goldsteinii]
EKLSPEIIKNKHIILIYNTMWDTPLNIPVEQIPENYRFTTDRQYYSQAQTVIFHLPTLINELENDLDKPEGQIWVAWTLECEENYPFFKDPEFMELFDYRISYHQTADVIQSYLHDNFIPLMKQPVDTKERANNICMLISSPINQSSRQEYLKELMREIPIDSYGKLFNNKKMDQDNGRESKINLYKQYKFVIAFENACATDYVTEKFFDPLIAGAVPIYLGAPNINEFAPGEHCFIHANDFKSPKELADYIEECYNNEQEYQSFFQWKQKDLRPQFIEKAQLQKTAPFIRLCELI